MLFGVNNIGEPGSNNSYAFGENNKIRANSDRSFMFGQGNETYSASQIIIGEANVAHPAAAQSKIIGTDCQMYPDNAITIGNGNIVRQTASESITIGFQNEAQGAGGFIFGGPDNITRNTSANAFGQGTDVSGRYATAFGRNTRAPWYGSFVLGQYNDITEYSNSPNAYEFVLPGSPILFTPNNISCGAVSIT